MGKIFRYKGLVVNAFGIPVSGEKKKQAPTSKRNYSRHQCFISSFGNTAKKDLIVMYNIPDNQKSEREWLLRQLKKFDYIVLQDGVWVGPSPLPRDFLTYLKSIGILKQIKILKLVRPYSKGENDLS